MDVTSHKAAVTAQIRSRIVAGALAMGSRVSDKELADQLGISRTPVREALLQLQSEGLIVVRPRSGTFVFEADRGDLRDICELRSLFEVGALRLGAERDANGLVSHLMTPVARASLALDAGDFAVCEALDTAFHENLVEFCDNRLLILSYSNISDKVRALRSRLAQTRERVGQAIAQHRRIIDLIAVGQIDAAASQIGQHVVNVREQLEMKIAALDAA